MVTGVPDKRLRIFLETDAPETVPANRYETILEEASHTAMVP
jgi:hypothetical protein